MGYSVIEAEDAPYTNYENSDEWPIEADKWALAKGLECQCLGMNIFGFEEGQGMPFHAHPHQEEVFYVLDGTFEVELGRPGQEEQFEVDEGSVFSASPYVGKGYECVSEDGKMLCLGAPSTDEEEWVDFESMSDEEIDEKLEEHQRGELLD